MSHESGIIDQFRNAMAEHGISTREEIIADGKLHRFHVDGDSKGAINGFYKLHADGVPNGIYGCNKRYGNEHQFKWKFDKPLKPLTPEEKRAWAQDQERKRAAKEAEQKKQREAAAHHANFMWEQAAPCEGDDHPYLQRKGVKSHGLRVGSWEKIDSENGEVNVVSKQALLVPIRDLKKTVHSLQAIFTGKIYGDRDKDFVKDGAKAGLFYTFGKPQKIVLDGVERIVIMIGEGYATLASAHEASGHAAVVAFDAGNLLAVAQTFRERYPDAVLLLLADNDQWTGPTPEHPNIPENPGLTKAREAAKAVGGLLAVPPFAHSEGKPGKNGKLSGPTDFNDLHALRGIDAVRDVIQASLSPKAEEAPPWEADAEAEQTDPAPHMPPADEMGVPDDDTLEGENEFANNRHFRCLGEESGTYYFLKKGKINQILGYTPGAISMKTLLSLAPLNWWEGAMLGTGVDGGKFKIDQAIDFVFSASRQIGIFDKSFTRGRGAWMDEQRMVINLGDKLLIDGDVSALGSIESEYLYQGGKRISSPHPAMLKADEGKGLLEIASMFRWARPASAHLLCGWLLLSPLCGALRWRPHAWITGGAGSGKSTIMTSFVHRLMPNGMAIFALGDSTEAGLRQALDSDALPLLIDESESDNEAAAAKMQKILVMLRQSSSDTGAQTYRGTVSGDVQSFQVRIMALLSSIGVSLERQQDKERVITLSLLPKRESGATDVENWPAIRAALNKIARDETINARFFARAVGMADVIMDSIDVFTEAAAQFFGTAREGDQIGALMAGAWCLTNDKTPTPQEALASLQRFDWLDHQDGKTEEREDLIATIMGRTVIRQGGVRTSVGKLMARAAGYDVQDMTLKPSEADSELHNYGMKVKDGNLYIHPKNDELIKLMRDTMFSADLRGRLKRIAGCDNAGGGGFRIGEVNTSGLRLPMRVFLGDREGVESAGPPPEPAF